MAANLNLGDPLTVASAKRAIDQAAMTGHWLLVVGCIAPAPMGGQQIGVTWCAQDFPDDAVMPMMSEALKKIKSQDNARIIKGQAPSILAP
jgi:hypothetical protein